MLREPNKNLEKLANFNILYYKNTNPVELKLHKFLKVLIS